MWPIIIISVQFNIILCYDSLKALALTLLLAQPIMQFVLYLVNCFAHQHWMGWTDHSAWMMLTGLLEGDPVVR